MARTPEDQMSVNPDNSIYVPQPSAYGRIIRERGTRRLLFWAAAMLVAWYLYATIHGFLMSQKQWPKLQPLSAGLTVLGLRDRDKPGWEHRYEARESNRSWQIRYNEDYMGETNEETEEPTPESQDRGTSDPGARRGTNSGSVVPMEEVLRECPVVLTGPQLAGAGIEEGYEPLISKSYYKVHLRLTDEGTSRYFQFSDEHDEERLVFVLDNKVITCAQIPRKAIAQWIMPISSSSLSIGPIWSKQDAQRLADYINGQRK